MTGKIDLKGDLALIEQGGDWLIASDRDVVEQSDGWVLSEGATPVGVVGKDTDTQLSASDVVAALDGQGVAVQSVAVGGGTPIGSFEGANLSVDEGGVLQATDTDTQLSAADIQQGGIEEISVTGLSGDLADAQDPKPHGNAVHDVDYSKTGHDHAEEQLGTSSAPVSPSYLQSATLTNPGSASDEAVRRGDVTDAVDAADLQASSEPWTIYVSSTGDDTNDGLSEANALASIEEALTRVPRLPIVDTAGESVRILLEGGTTFTENRLFIDIPWVNSLLIGSYGASPATINSVSGKEVLWVHRSSVELGGVNITPNDAANPYENTFTLFYSELQIYGNGDNTITSGHRAGVRAAEGPCHVHLVEGTIDCAPTGGATGVVSYGNSLTTSSGSFVVTGATREAIIGDRGGALRYAGIIRDSPVALRSQDGAAVKLASTGQIVNCNMGLDPQIGSLAVCDGSPDVSGAAQLLPDDFRGNFRFGARDLYYIGGRRVTADGTAPLAQLTTTDTSTNLSATTPAAIPWDTQLTLEAGYAHDTVNNSAALTFEESDKYWIGASVVVEGDNATDRQGPSIYATLNGAELEGTRGYTYLRNSGGAITDSVTLMRAIDVAAGDTLRIIGEDATGQGGTATTKANESVLCVESR